ncbi:MAG: HK97 family phage prohead protease [bacterium]
MNIEKSLWTSHGNDISLSVPFTKVNREKRTVSGFATLDNVDQTGDVVTSEASVKAFESFRGNIREMHGSLAVGKMVSFKPETFYDPATKEFYNGVYVTAYISKGAQDSWEKVLDGTLSGFSIGGKIKESDNEVNKSTGKTVRFIKDYELMELSIVDSPANELCNILSIQKVNGQYIAKGIAVDVITENIFYCEDSNSVFISTEKTYDSPVSGKPAQLIGWVESSDVNKAKEIDKILDAYKHSRFTLPDTQKIAKQANAEGGNEMSDNTENVVAEDVAVDAAVEVAVEETAVVADDAAVEAPAEDAVVEDVPAETLEKAAEVSEDKVDEPDFAKMLGDLKGFFSETLNKASEANAAQVTTIQETVEAFSKSVDARISELAEQHTVLSSAVNDIKSTIDGVQKRVDAVESETAIKKSSDLGRSEEVTIKKSKWNGSFLGSVNEIFN